MSKTYYMHTINGWPATLSRRGDRLCYATEFPKGNKLERSLKSVRKNERIARRFVVSLGFDPGNYKYGYVRFVVPDD